MRILLVYPAPPSSDWPKGIFRSQWVPTGIACIATVLRRSGHEVKVYVSEEHLVRNRFDWPAARAGLRSLMQEFAPQIVGLSLVTPGVIEGRSIAQDAKTLCGPGTLVVAGGPHPTALPEQFLQECPQIDVAVVGEGEITLRELAEHGPSPSVRGIAFRSAGGVTRTPERAPVEDLDTLGPPAYDLFGMDYYTSPGRFMIRWLKLAATNLRTTRGCTNRCRFCAGHLVSGLGVRFHSIPYVIEQMQYVRRQFGVEAIHFEDDSVGADRSRLLELCEEIRRAGLHRQLKWDAALRVDQTDAELLGQMKSAGCIQVEYGFESGSSNSLRRLGKNATAELNRRAALLTHQAGLRIYADIMVGLPGETARDLAQTVKFLRWARPEVISAGRLCPLPGTAIYQDLSPQVRSGLPWGAFSYYDTPDPLVNLTAMSDQKFHLAYRRFMKYTIRPQLQWAYLRDTPSQEGVVKRALRRRLAGFILRHPLRALRVPW
ncbi:MAG: B12-binding domain-containing radical SAM protein [Phycisphaerae bacterium]|nr:B12-binding domain-containing radical SAM protein [Phycisphaerae bacterium]